eukprot:scaffold90574_cov63-Phaeocystis_antarctica.AAC.3
MLVSLLSIACSSSGLPTRGSTEAMQLAPRVTDGWVRVHGAQQVEERNRSVHKQAPPRPS